MNFHAYRKLWKTQIKFQTLIDWDEINCFVGARVAPANIALLLVVQILLRAQCS